MKTLGLIGGTIWLSTVEYYALLNKMVNERLGASNSARLILYSLNFEDVIPPADIKAFKSRITYFIDAATKLQNAGADCIVMCANTPHMFADEMALKLNIPIIHIAEATAGEIKSAGLTKVGLLGTRVTMESDFYKKKLAENGISTLIPNETERNFINSSIFNELGKNILTKELKEKYLNIIERLRSEGAGGIVLGCTEIPLLIKQTDCDIPLFDTTLIHSKAAVDFALS
jgi:aspartate racemase